MNILSSKECETCGKVFKKKWNYSRNYWATARFCSLKCCPHLFKKGEVGFWYGKKRPDISGTSHHLYGRKMSPEWIQKLSVAHRGIMLSENAKQKLRLYNLAFGKRPPIQVGAANKNWKGGVTSQNEKIRKSLEYKYWRTNVFRRDDYTCQACGKRGKGDLEADHELPFALFPDLRFEVLNGRTLCKDCHKRTPTYGDRRVSEELHLLEKELTIGNSIFAL